MPTSKTLRAGPYKSMVHRWFYEHENPLILLRGPLYLNGSMKNRVQSSNGRSIMRVKLAQAGEGGVARLSPFTTFTITSTVAVYAPAEWADTLTLFHLCMAA
jgi:hypothetical protein